jgi:hypothetical protein
LAVPLEPFHQLESVGACQVTDDVGGLAAGVSVPAMAVVEIAATPITIVTSRVSIRWFMVSLDVLFVSNPSSFTERLPQQALNCYRFVTMYFLTLSLHIDLRAPALLTAPRESEIHV